MESYQNGSLEGFCAENPESGALGHFQEKISCSQCEVLGGNLEKEIYGPLLSTTKYMYMFSSKG